jgi:protein phosphatase 2C-like protein
MRVSGGRRAGRSHRQQDVPCQDAYALLDAPEAGRVAVAVADGLGSRPLSHLGSDVACQAAVASLGQADVWDEPALLRAFEAAREAIQSSSAGLQVPPDHLAATLQVAALTREKVIAGMVGDGAVVGCGPDVRVLLAPAESEYANEVVPLTHRDWRSHFRYAEQEAAQCLLVFTDGLTRLLLARTRGQWEPFQPFFDAFLPKVRGPAFDEGLVPRFLEADYVDTSWDDDKCLVVVGRDDAGV